MAGVGAHSTKQVLELAEDAAKAGANHLLVLPPAYFGKATTLPTVKRFLADVAAKASLPVVVYSFPGVTNGVDIDSDTIETIVRASAAAFPNGRSNVVGVKLTCAQVGKITRLTAAFVLGEFAVFGGQSDFLIGGLSVAFANIAPKTIAQIYRLYKEGKVDEVLACTGKQRWRRVLARMELQQPSLLLQYRRPPGRELRTQKISFDPGRRMKSWGKQSRRI
jgi:dihydrodipicolinate synthase/N-acetylneuraminate lyase